MMRALWSGKVMFDDRPTTSKGNALVRPLAEESTVGLRVRQYLPRYLSCVVTTSKGKISR